MIPVNGENSRRKTLSAIHPLSTGRHYLQDLAGATANQFHLPPGHDLSVFAQYMLYAVMVGGVFGGGDCLLLVTFEVLI